MKSLTIKQHCIIHQIIMWFGWAIALLAALLKPSVIWLLWVGLGIVIGSLVWRICFIKCPHCGNRLIGCRIMPKCCPNCGKEIS